MSGLTKALVLLVAILAIGGGLAYWKSTVGHTAGNFNSISKQEVEMLLGDVAKTNPMVLKRFKDDPELKQEQLKNFKELLAFASQAQKDGLANESPYKEELQNIRNEVVAVNYDKEINKDKGPMPPFGMISEDQVKAFWGEGQQPEKGFFENLKDKIGLGAKDHELEFKKFLDSKVAILKKDNPQMADRQITDEERAQAREFFAKIQTYVEEFEKKADAGELPKEFVDKVNVQVKLQQAQFLARLYSDKMAEKAKVTDEEVAKYIAEHPELDPSAKRTQAEEILNRAKGGEDFAALAKEFSTDPGSKDKGGLYENIRLGQMVKPFEDAAMSVQPGEIVPNLVETDFGFHIVKLESKNEAKEGEEAGATFNARHILISTGFKDPENPMGREVPVKQYARAKLEEEKQKKLIEEIVASNHIEVPADFDVPEVSEEQIQQMLDRQQQQMQQMQMQMPDEEDADAAPAAGDKKAEPKKAEPKKK